MIIRPAGTGDARGIVDLVNPVIRNTTVTFTTRERTVAGVARSIAETGAYFVACEGAAVLGYACHFPFRSGPGYVHAREHSITLSPEARGRGLGRQLMLVLEDHARGRQVHVMMAGVSAENPAGIAFHAAIGYREVGRVPQVGRKFDRWIDLVLMQKILGMSH